ncbi:acid phosphatase [Paenarthrobacter sp. Z7-10]|uniref:alkaline phosphatase family protein n=1 Tax=Paenarthrobacter sp. Z7-10 TaxID=2787635 RepID=UPI0022A9C164|nr:alkaline phosphatase family protein [Paenarthrobacter sp. Z7-10]MCZ2404545.1 acid phosphatase [Paenarthrobacter sp. Z7-10]
MKNGQSGRRSAVVLAAAVLAVIAAGCAPAAGNGPRPSSSDSEPAPQPQDSAPAVSGPGLDHVVIIVEENKEASHILGSSSAPYINKLANEYALATNYQAITHPSLPNYLALTSGTNAGITNDCNPPGGACTARVPNVGDAIAKSGRSWKMYAESMPAPCTAGNAGRYAVKHNPFMYYPSITRDNASCAAHVVPFTQLEQDLGSAATLPDYAFISPDLCSDMHDCPVQTGDEWLSREVPAILASPAFSTQNSLLVVTWDEGDKASNKVLAIFAGPAARRSFKSAVAYNHYSLLHTIEQSWGIAPMTGNDANAPVMSDLMK